MPSHHTASDIQAAGEHARLEQLESMLRPEREPSERSILQDRPPINNELPYHEFIESEFEQGAGRCDRCGGGPLAAIHQKPVDQMARIADALERIAAAMERGWPMSDQKAAAAEFHAHGLAGE